MKVSPKTKKQGSPNPKPRKHSGESPNNNQRLRPSGGRWRGRRLRPLRGQQLGWKLGPSGSQQKRRRLEPSRSWLLTSQKTHTSGKMETEGTLEECHTNRSNERTKTREKAQTKYTDTDDETRNRWGEREGRRLGEVTRGEAQRKEHRRHWKDTRGHGTQIRDTTRHRTMTTITCSHCCLLLYFFSGTLTVLPQRKSFLQVLRLQLLSGISLQPCWERGMLIHSFSTKEVGLHPVVLASLLSTVAFQWWHQCYSCDAAGIQGFGCPYPTICCRWRWRSPCRRAWGSCRSHCWDRAGGRACAWFRTWY